MRIIIIYISLQEVVKANYKFFEVDYYGADNDNYVAGEGFCCGDNSMKTKSIADDSPNYEKLQYYYHSDHLGSASYITNLDGEVVQHIEYVPFGEVFLEERNNTWNTPFLFNGKELDEETGLYYYGARYYNPRISLWYGVDPLAEKYPDFSGYAYCANNPVRLIDPDGKDWKDKVAGYGIGAITNIILGSTILRENYTPNDASDYNMALAQSDVAAMAIGGSMVIGGGATAASGITITGTGGTMALAGVSVAGVGSIPGIAVTITGAAAVVTGTATAAGGGIMMANAANNKSKGYNYGKNNKSATSKNANSSKSLNQLNKDVQTGKAPKGIKRFDTPKVKGEQPHVHFQDKANSALNRDGTWKHGGTKLTKNQAEYLRNNGFKLPID